MIGEAQMHLDNSAADGFEVKHAGIAGKMRAHPHAAAIFDLGFGVGMDRPIIERALTRRLSSDVAPPARHAADNGKVG